MNMELSALVRHKSKRLTMNYDPDIYRRMAHASYRSFTKGTDDSMDEKLRDLLRCSFPTEESFAASTQTVFDTLLRARDRSRVHPALRIASNRAFRMAVRWLIWTQNTF